MLSIRIENEILSDHHELLWKSQVASMMPVMLLLLSTNCAKSFLLDRMVGEYTKSCSIRKRIAVNHCSLLA